MQTSIRQLSYFATHLLKTLAIISSDVSHKSLEAKTKELVCALRAFEPAFWAQWVVIKTVVGSVNDKIFARRRHRAGFDNGIERLFFRLPQITSISHRAISEFLLRQMKLLAHQHWSAVCDWLQAATRTAVRCCETRSSFNQSPRDPWSRRRESLALR